MCLALTNQTGDRAPHAFHLAKLAGAAEAGSGDESDFVARRLPDLPLFGVKLATLTNEPLAS